MIREYNKYHLFMFIKIKYILLRNSEKSFISTNTVYKIITFTLSISYNVFVILISKNAILNFQRILWKTPPFPIPFYYQTKLKKKKLLKNFKLLKRNHESEMTSVRPFCYFDWKLNKIPNSVWEIVLWHLMKLSYFKICKK